jgi:polysaccharide deacetylase family protein (PEP-CTERM system associated)
MAPAAMNFMTFDIGEWYHANYSGLERAEYSGDTNLEALTDRLIDLCAERGVATTCFVLAAVAKDKPRVIKKLHAAGHEIASHGCGHELVYTLGAKRFAADLAISRDILEDLTGEKVLGYRAPSFSVTQDILCWFYAVLEEAGLAYSSSVFPGRTFLYGVPGFPARVHRPVVSGRECGIVEFPLPLVRLFGKQMPLYIRLFPAWAIAHRMARDNRSGKPVVLYAHPREIDRDQARLDLRFVQARIHYWGIRGCESKLRSVLRSARFGRMRDYLGLASA